MNVGKWGAVAIVVGYLAWSNAQLKKENDQIALQFRNANLQALTQALQQQNKDQLAREQALIDHFEKLSKNLQTNAQSAQDAYIAMTQINKNTPHVKPEIGQSEESAQLGYQATTNMNKVFSDINALSRKDDQ